jgi:hypothetical protein
MNDCQNKILGFQVEEKLEIISYCGNKENQAVRRREWLSHTCMTRYHRSGREGNVASFRVAPVLE